MRDIIIKQKNFNDIYVYVDGDGLCYVDGDGDLIVVETSKSLRELAAALVAMADTVEGKG